MQQFSFITALFAPEKNIVHVIALYPVFTFLRWWLHKCLLFIGRLCTLALALVFGREVRAAYCYTREFTCLDFLDASWKTKTISHGALTESCPPRMRYQQRLGSRFVSLIILFLHATVTVPSQTAPAFSLSFCRFPLKLSVLPACKYSFSDSLIVILPQVRPFFGASLVCYSVFVIRLMSCYQYFWFSPDWAYISDHPSLFHHYGSSHPPDRRSQY